jgi:NodT family efflux transporter outer membrane factor (OMF) lipoprotein
MGYGGFAAFAAGETMWMAREGRSDRAQIAGSQGLREGGYGTADDPGAVGSRLGLAAVLLLAVALAGCTSWSDYVRNGFKVGPNYCRPAAAVADHWIDDQDPNVGSQRADDAAWWRTFNDPVLDSLVQTAYRQNLTLRLAGFRILEARAQRAIAVGELFPQSQQAFGDYTRTNLSKNAPNGAPSLRFDEWAVGTNLAWELDFWGRFRRAIEAADAHLDASVENFDDVLVLLVAEVAQRYTDLRTAEQRLEYARKNVHAQRESLRLADVRFQNGKVTRLDVTQGQSNLSQTEAAIPLLEATRRQAANQLCILLGMPPRNIEELLGLRPIPSAPPRVVVGIPADLLRRRPDVRRAEREAAAQSALIGIAAAELYPHFSISGSIFLDAANFQDLFDPKSFAGNVGPSFNWNILNYGRLVNNIRVQDARFQQLVLAYQDTVLRANAEVENALVGFLDAQQSVRFLANSADAATQSLGLVRLQYEEGKTDFNRVLVIEQNLTQQEDQLAQAQGAVAQNLIRVYRSIGGGWQIRLAPQPPLQSPGPPSAESVPPPAAVPTAPPPQAPAAPIP